MRRPILLHGGSAVIHHANDILVTEKKDILIIGNSIEKVAPVIEAGDAEVIDCTGKIISPGFVDTHYHCWEAQLQGRHKNHVLVDYLTTDLYPFSPDDIFIAQLSGCLELVDKGITTVVDHSQVDYTSKHVDALLEATFASGIRSIHFNSPTNLRFSDTKRGLASFQKFVPNPTFADGAGRFGISHDDFILTNPCNTSMSPAGEEIGVKPLYSHDTNVLKNGIHCDFICEQDIVTRAHESLLRQKDHHMKSRMDKHQAAWFMNQKAEEAFNLLTIRAARSLKMEDQIGSIAEGKLADLIIFDSKSLAAVADPEKYPVAAILVYSGTRDIDTVIIDGVVRKQDRTFLPLEIGGSVTWDWRDMIEKLYESYERIENWSIAMSHKNQKAC